MKATVPRIEISDDAHAARIRRPDGKSHAAFAFMGDQVRAEFVVDACVLAFAEEMKIKIAERW
jgi:hypothetical protein